MRTQHCCGSFHHKSFPPFHFGFYLFLIWQQQEPIFFLAPRSFYSLDWLWKNRQVDLQFGGLPAGGGEAAAAAAAAATTVSRRQNLFLCHFATLKKRIPLGLRLYV